MLTFWLIIIGAVITRIVVLPFTIRTERYLFLLRALFRTMYIRVNVIKAKFTHDPAKAYTEEIHSIDNALSQNQDNKKRFLFIIPVLIQALVLSFVFAAFFGDENDFQSEAFLWIEDFSSHDPYYVVQLLFLISLIIKHRVFLPYKKKGLLYGLDFLLWFYFYNFPAGFVLFLTTLFFLSALQSFAIDSQSKKIPIANADETASMSEDFDSEEWLLKFKNRGWLFLVDDVFLSLFLALGMIGAALIYLGFFYWQRKKLWDL